MAFFINLSIILLLGVLPNLAFLNDPFQFNYPKTVIIYALSLIIASGFLIKQLVTTKTITRGFKIYLDEVILYLWLGTLLVSTISSVSLYSSLFGDWYSPTSHGLIFTVCLIIIYFYFRSIANFESLKKILFIITLGGVYAFLWGIGSGSGQTFYNGLPLRMASLEYHTVYFANFLVTVLPAGITMIFLSSTTKLKILAGFGSLSILSGILLSLTRGSWISVILSGLVFIYLIVKFSTRFRLKKLPKLTVTLGVLPVFLLVIYLFPILQNRWQETFKAPVNKSSISIRLDEYNVAFEMIKHHPLVGVGPDSVRYLYPKFRPVELNQNLSEWNKITTYIRSYLLQLAVTVGVLGSLLFAGLTFIKSYQSFKFFSSLKGEKLVIFMGIFICFITVIANNLLYDPSISQQVFFWSLAGSLSGVSGVFSKPLWQFNLSINLKPKLKVIILGIVCLLVLGITLILAVDLLSKFYFEKRLTEPDRSKRLEFISAATALNPFNNSYRYVYVSEYLDRIGQGVVFRSQDRDQLSIWIDSTEKQLNSAKNLDPNDPLLAEQSLALALQKVRFAKVDQKAGEYKIALEAAKLAQELNPTSPEIADLITLTHLAMDGKKLQEAEAAAIHSLKLMPGFSTGYHHLGEALKQQERYQEAIGAYQKALEIDPEDITANQEIKQIQDLLVNVR